MDKERASTRLEGKAELAKAILRQDIPRRGESVNLSL